MVKTGAGVGDGVAWRGSDETALWAAAVESSRSEKNAPLPRALEEDAVLDPLSSAVMEPFFGAALVKASTVIVAKGLSNQIVLKFQQFLGHQQSPEMLGFRS